MAPPNDSNVGISIGGFTFGPGPNSNLAYVPPPISCPAQSEFPRRILPPGEGDSATWNDYFSEKKPTSEDDYRPILASIPDWASKNDDYLAVYRAHHYWGDGWGIYCYLDRMLAVASAFSAETKTDFLTSKWAVFSHVVAHEYFHYLCECHWTLLCNTFRKTCLHEMLHNTPHPIEEGLANLFSSFASSWKAQSINQIEVTFTADIPTGMVSGIPLGVSVGQSQMLTTHPIGTGAFTLPGVGKLPKINNTNSPHFMEWFLKRQCGAYRLPQNLKVNHLKAFKLLLRDYISLDIQNALVVPNNKDEGGAQKTYPSLFGLQGPNQTTFADRYDRQDDVLAPVISFINAGNDRWFQPELILYPRFSKRK